MFVVCPAIWAKYVGRINLQIRKASRFDASFASVPLGDTSKTPNEQTTLPPIFGNVVYFQKFLKLTVFFKLIKMDRKIDAPRLEISFLGFYYVFYGYLFKVNTLFLLIYPEKVIWVITFDGIHTFALTDHALEFFAVKQLFYKFEKQNIFQIQWETKHPWL